jgi:hypothetical protein
MGRLAVPFGVWLVAVGGVFAIWPTPTSHVANRLRLHPQNRVSPRQMRYARLAGMTLAILGMLTLAALAADY